MITFFPSDPLDGTANVDPSEFDTLPPPSDPNNDECWHEMLVALERYQPKPGTAVADSRQYVVFSLGDRRFALNLQPMREIIQLPAIVPVPLAPPELSGLTELRGQALPVLSLQRLLRLDVAADAEPCTFALVVDIGIPVALSVGQVNSILQPDSIDPPPAALENAAWAGVIRDEAGIVTVLDIQGLLEQSLPGYEKLLDSIGGDGVEKARKVARRQERRLVSYLIERQEYATPIEQIREIVPLPAELPQAPGSAHSVVGMMSLRGEIMPLLGLRRLLGQPDLPPEEQRACRVMILQGPDGQGIGLLVDGVSEVLSVDPLQIDRLPEQADPSGQSPLSGVCRLDEGRRLVGLVEIDRLVERREDAEAGASAYRTPEPQREPDEQFVVFRLHREEFGVPILQVQEIVHLTEPPSPLPGMPAFLLGVSALRGELLPVIDQRRRFALPLEHDGEQQRIMVFRFGEMNIGFVVDAVSEVLPVPAQAIGPSPAAVQSPRRLTPRVANLADSRRLVQLLDPLQLLDTEELRALSETDFTIH